MIGGEAVSWCSKCQLTITTSTTEAECMALSAADKEAIWFTKIIKGPLTNAHKKDSYFL